MLEHVNIVIVAVQHWDIDIGSNCKSIARELSKTNRVLYVNTPLDRKTSILKSTDPGVRRRLAVIRGQQDGLEQVSDTLWTYYPATITESINVLPDNALYTKLNTLNSRRFAAEIRHAASRTGFDDYLLFNDSEMFLGQHLKEFLDPLLSIYYIRDNLVWQPYFARHGKRLEPLLIEQSDLVVANSDYLADYARQYNPDSYMIGQGCDISRFTAHSDRLPLPDDAAAIASPRIGYLGNLTSMRLDIPLLERLAAERPNWNFMLVGPEDEAFRSSALHSRSNVYFGGPKPLDEVPAWIAAFDVAINPQVVNPLTIGNYPLKIDEYLAMGKPVVATATRAMDFFREHCYLASTAEEYGELIERALDEDSPQLQDARKRFAQRHTWHNSVEELSRHTLRLLEESGTTTL
ncbi:glycosyltransferase [Prosthecochloris sp. N3]|uniref:Glycosyltransferase n=1 Tax=Prosthecochloris ethylica TaxID=2743976 RepID=A0ABR9XRJ2_9CHLB|nr:MULTISPECIES: glycosyltransferase [Prosthecochloris]MBF0586754.1 glycosyltransferase [Prosthecochloris ethylica]MBF0636660.1 glycosyltransferase [Prosthecochloris ethylica]NUK47941.1 glycosyltransferase [Prosthecochloris ethylica]RNA65243.1 glycosyltransferase family 1 protein [Prosthecochloris sp. ZM_2]